MRIDGIHSVREIHRPVAVARLRDVSRVEPSGNRLIAAAAGVPNVTAPAPTRLLTVEETRLVEALRETAATRATPATRAYAEVGADEALRPRFDIKA